MGEGENVKLCKIIGNNFTRDQALGESIVLLLYEIHSAQEKNNIIGKYLICLPTELQRV